MNNKSKIKKILRIAELAKNEEQAQQFQWAKSKKEVDNAENKLSQLNSYFDTYKKSSPNAINAQLYQNQQMILDWVRGATSEQENDIENCKKREEEQFNLLKIKRQERKAYEKLHAKKINAYNAATEKSDYNTLQEAITRLFEDKQK